jgi:hypothetical protein
MKFLFFLLIPFFSYSQKTVLKYEWRKISGPTNYKIVSPNSAVTDVTDLEVGIYQFELKVTNSRGLSARDTMVLRVSPPADNRAYATGKVKLSSRFGSSSQ